MNIRRSIASVAVAGAVVVAGGAAATALPTYPATDYTVTCSTAVSPVTKTFTCWVKGPDGASVQLQTDFAGDTAKIIAGTDVSAAKTVTSGQAAFTVQAPSIEGNIGITGIVEGVAIPGEGVTVQVTDAELSGTGFENMGLAVGAGVLLVAGATTVFVAARRRSHSAV